MGNVVQAARAIHVAQSSWCNPPVELEVDDGNAGAGDGDADDVGDEAGEEVRARRKSGRILIGKQFMV